MGIGRAQVVPTDRQVGAQISDGSLLFDLGCLRDEIELLDQLILLNN